jgi:archaeal chaperonin
MEPKNRLAHIQVGIDVSNTVRATLGPRGMNKMVLKDDVPILTNDGATIVKNLNLSHPVGKMFIGLAESQESAIGDGTTTAVVLAGQLLENALVLLNKKMHPMTIINGYNLARQSAISFAEGQAKVASKEMILKTSFGSKIPPQQADYFTRLILDYVKTEADLDNIRFAKIENKEFEESGVLRGAIMPGYTINDRMPSIVEGKIAFLDMQNNLEFAKFQITETEELDKLETRLRDFKKEIIQKLIDYEVKCVFMTDTNPQFENFLTEAGIMGIVVHKRNDWMDNICKSTGCVAIADPQANVQPHLGEARVEYKKKEQAIFISSPNSEIVTFILSGPTKQVLDELERAIDDVISIARQPLKVVTGGGAFEIELAAYLKKYATEIGGKEQLAIEKFAEAVDTLPLILAENCGFDALEVISILKTKHKQGEVDAGVDPLRMVSDAKVRGIVEPVKLKTHAINSATDVTNLILKLDDIYIGGGSNG